MQTYKVDITVDAFAQIREEYYYIREQSAGKAEQWLAKLYERVDSLRTMPHRCSFIGEKEAFEQEVRELLHFSHRIIFTIDEERSLVLVHTVRHASRDRIQGTEF